MTYRIISYDLGRFFSGLCERKVVMDVVVVAGRQQGVGSGAALPAAPAGHRGRRGAHSGGRAGLVRCARVSGGVQSGVGEGEWALIRL